MTVTMTDDIRRRVRAQLVLLDKSQEDLAGEMGKSYSYINKLLSGKRDGSADTWVELLQKVGLKLQVVPDDA